MRLAEELTLEASQPLRPPQQSRSKASYERMLAAARALMEGSGSADFTLNDVSREGKVSIGSIYNRISSKDELVATVHAQIIEEVDAALTRKIDTRPSKCTTLPAAIDHVFEALAETLSAHAVSLRPMMQIAARDPRVGAVGKASYARSEAMIVSQLMRYSSENRHIDAERACTSAFRIFYAAIARHLGFGIISGSEDQGDWAQLKADLVSMTTSFLVKPTSDS
jgi:AcrR family transcriptional regulator